MNIKRNIGNRIRHLRQLKNLSQMELAEKVGVSFQQIQKYESGKSEITLSRLNDIAEALNISPAEILSDEVLLPAKETSPQYERGDKKGKQDYRFSSTENEIISFLREIDDEEFNIRLKKLLEIVVNRYTRT